MIDFDKVEKLKERTGITYEAAKAVLEETNGDILDAFILLEQRGEIPVEGPQKESDAKTNTADSTSDYSTQGHSYTHGYQESSDSNQYRATDTADHITFGEIVGRVFRFIGKLIHKGNQNSFHVRRNNEEFVSVPVTILVILLIVAFWITLPLLIIGLICGFQYSFMGPDLGTDQVNSAMHNVSDATQKAVYNMREAADDFAKDVKKGKAAEDKAEGRDKVYEEGQDSTH